MAFWNRGSSSSGDGEGSAGRDAHGRLERAVAQHLPDADGDTRRLVTAVAGLLACVAYADHEYADSEAEHVRSELGRVHGLSADGVDAICHVLRESIQDLAFAGDQAWSRELKELADRDLRREVLEVLVDLAAADEDVSVAETNHLRRLTFAMGLEQSDYDAVQARHRERLSVLK